MDGVIKQLVELEERAQKMIADAKSRASELRLQAQKELEQYEVQQIQESEVFCKGLIEKAKVEGEKYFQEILTSAQVQVVQMEQKYEEIKDAAKREVSKSLFV